MSCFDLCVARMFHVLLINRALRASCSKEGYSRICRISSFGRVGSFVSVVAAEVEGGFCFVMNLKRSTICRAQVGRIPLWLIYDNEGLVIS